MAKTLVVMDSNQTLYYILKNKCSVARFGDGELNAMRGYSIDFQHTSKDVKRRLRNVKTNEKCLVCIPDIFDNSRMNKDVLAKHEYKFWRRSRFLNRHNYKRFFAGNVLGDAFISRFYLRYKDHSHTAEFVEKLKKLWDKKDILFVEGKKSRLGVGNDLFSNANSIRRILCPSKNAFDKIDEIEKEIVKNHTPNTLVICALGPTATAIAYEMSSQFQVLDLGHIDIEYEWFLQKATKKVPIENKYVNETKKGRNPKDCLDETYLSQVVAEIE